MKTLVIGVPFAELEPMNKSHGHKTETIATITFFKNRFVTMIETPTFLSSDIIAEKTVYKHRRWAIYSPISIRFFNEFIFYFNIPLVYKIRTII